jgi:hypothetical protein
MPVHVQCQSCGSWAITDEDPPDGAVHCTSPEGTPEGSLEGSCCTKGHTHEEHAAYARERHDDGSACRPVTITIMGTGLGGTPVSLGGALPAGGPRA